MTSRQTREQTAPAAVDVTALLLDVAELVRAGGLLEQLVALLPEPVAAANTGTTSHHKVTGSPAPWHPEAAAALFDIHAGAREVEDELREHLGFARLYAGRTFAGVPGAQAVRGASDPNTVKALNALADLAAAAGGEQAKRTAKAVSGWCRQAREVGDIDLDERWEPLRRVPGRPATACPYCETFALRQQARAGVVRCTNRACVDGTGKRPKARVKRGKVSGEDMLVFRDDTVLFVPSASEKDEKLDHTPWPDHLRPDPDTEDRLGGVLVAGRTNADFCAFCQRFPAREGHSPTCPKRTP